ncbi:MAG: TolC family protein [Candidatus Sericytochromatia bacterium]|nr:TolC family protein [Candidatus Sericytochromatia bacterium]
MRRGVALSLAAVAALAAVTPAWAQQVEPLGLGEAVLLARTNSLAAQVSRQTVSVTEAERAATISNTMPNLALSSSANYQELPGASAGAFSGGGFGNLVGFPATGAYVDTTVSASQVIFDAFATRDQLAILDANLRIGQLGAAQAEQDAMVQAAVAYFDVLRAEGLARVALEGLKSAQEQLRLGELRFKAGMGTRPEVLQQRARLANAMGQLTQARNGINLARLTLSNALNAPVGDRPLVAQAAVPAVALNLGKDLQAALARRPEIQQVALRQQADETRVALESRALWPTLQANGRYAQRNLSEGQFQAGVTVNWALFDSFRARNRMASAFEQARVTRLQLEQTRQRVALEIRQQVQARQEAQQRLTAAREGLAASQEAYRLALRRYEVGVATAFEVADVQATHAQSHQNFVQAENDLRVAEIRLARALGLDLAPMLARGAQGAKQAAPPRS